MNIQMLVIRYALFAALATFVNLGTQRMVLLAGSGATWFVLALGAGTLTGLMVKYILDKRFIFRDYEGGFRAHGRKFSLYALMGVATTLIFWGSETAFWLIWQTEAMREIGALLGLSVGYVIKYKLDKIFVFKASPSMAVA